MADTSNLDGLTEDDLIDDAEVDTLVRETINAVCRGQRLAQHTSFCVSHIVDNNCCPPAGYRRQPVCPQQAEHVDQQHSGRLLEKAGCSWKAFQVCGHLQSRAKGWSRASCGIQQPMARQNRRQDASAVGEQDPVCACHSILDGNLMGKQLRVQLVSCHPLDIGPEAAAVELALERAMTLVDFIWCLSHRQCAV